MAALRGQFLHVLLLIALLFPCCYALPWEKCSTRCKSKFCQEAPLLRYGKYCGIFYTGCPGEAPCDGLDGCCMIHDHCIGKSNYLSITCNQALLDCVRAYQNSGDGQFPGNTCDIGDVEHTITVAIEAGVWIGDGDGDGTEYGSDLPPYDHPSSVGYVKSNGHIDLCLFTFLCWFLSLSFMFEIGDFISQVK